MTSPKRTALFRIAVLRDLPAAGQRSIAPALSSGRCRDDPAQAPSAIPPAMRSTLPTRWERSDRGFFLKTEYSLDTGEKIRLDDGKAGLSLKGPPAPAGGDGPRDGSYPSAILRNSKDGTKTGKRKSCRTERRQASRTMGKICLSMAVRSAWGPYGRYP